MWFWRFAGGVQTRDCTALYFSTLLGIASTAGFPSSPFFQGHHVEIRLFLFT
jgi:hypothetical protein